MTRAIFKAVEPILVSCFLVFSLFFSFITTVNADQVDLDINDSSSSDIVAEEPLTSDNSSKISSVPDLGDDQAFPFIPGFGKNSGKD